MATPSQTFIVRVWLEAGASPSGRAEPGAAAGVWRASATDAGSQDRRYFSSPESLMTYLTSAPKQATASSPTMDDAGPEWSRSQEEG